MSRRLKLLLALMIGLVALAAGELVLFNYLGPAMAIFVQVAVMGLATAIGTVTAPNLVHAALYLVAFFFLVACQFVLLEAEFMAAMQVLVYIGAVSILMMFGIMLTRNIQGDETTSGRWTGKLPAAFVAVAFFALLVAGIRGEGGMPAVGDRPARPKWSQTPTRPDLESDPLRRLAVEDMGRQLGVGLMTRWLIPFEVAGLLLTAALVGAVALAMSDGLELTPGGRLTSKESGPVTAPRPGSSVAESPRDPALAGAPASRSS